ncbi:hypothetical protein [uncultured Shewanella sp.]|uniref:hypothetical protein n=1 Tax=uncultured Shewanella sp. TaxID=173975 RepID=UPI00260FCF0B|nr:hypothetical protein [uncultured Shewanella sp.]
MNAPTPDDLKAMMLDLEQRKNILAKHFNHFEQLQAELEVINQRANKGDSTAIRKLANLNNEYPNGLQEPQRKILTSMKALENNFKDLKSQFGNLNSTHLQLNKDNTEVNLPKKNGIKKPKIKQFC